MAQQNLANISSAKLDQSPTHNSDQSIDIDNKLIVSIECFDNRKIVNMCA